MPTVHIFMHEGRTIDQKRALVQKVTTAVSEAVNVSASDVDVIVQENGAYDFARGGIFPADMK